MMKMKKSYNKNDYKKFVELRNQCSLIGFDNYSRNIGRLEMDKFLRGFNKETQNKLFARDNKEHNN